jgi:hypothetical protein
VGFSCFFYIFFVIVCLFKIRFSFGGCCGFFVQNSEKIYKEKKCEYTITYKNFFKKLYKKIYGRRLTQPKKDLATLLT